MSAVHLVAPLVGRRCGVARGLRERMPRRLGGHVWLGAVANALRALRSWCGAIQWRFKIGTQCRARRLFKASFGTNVFHQCQVHLHLNIILVEELTPIMGDQPEIWKAAAMADHFEKIQKLPDPVPGVPNFRRVPGYKIFCCGQPTKDGFEKALEKVSSLQNWDLLKSFDNF